MNKTIILLLCSLFWSLDGYSLTGQAYMDRFNTFSGWYQQLPFVPTPEFLEFVKQNAPLSNKLRDKWLYELARVKDWKQYTEYYQPTNDANLVCYNQIARFNQGMEADVLKESTEIWLVGESRPQACNTLFDLLLKHDNFDQNLITQRLALALDKRNVSLARYLLKQFKVPRLAAAETLSTIYQRPANILSLGPGEFHSYFYLYGLKRLVSSNMDQAIKIWEQPRTTEVMSNEHQQAFLAHIALYKAMRNHPDTQEWFNKIKPAYYNEVLVDWQIRFALKNRDWSRVESLINQASTKESPCWQYWLARALEAQGKKEEAQERYQSLAKTRQYYGFLASMRLKQKPSFANENPSTDLSTLATYQPIIEQIKSLYQSKKTLQASRLLNDFISELPKDEASALIYWVDSQLQWHDKSVFLSNNEILSNQLALRFPLAYKDAVTQYAHQYTVAPEFVYAIIRQESAFREDVTSVAGARGLMQVMPRTASVVAKANKIAYNNHNQLFGSQKNINIGIAYLRLLAKRFSNHPMLIAAAYNAGPRQVVHWLKDHPTRDIDLWIETIPWQETRNYLKNVMAFSIVYQYRLNLKPNLNDFMMPL